MNLFKIGTGIISKTIRDNITTGDVISRTFQNLACGFGIYSLIGLRTYSSLNRIHFCRYSFDKKILLFFSEVFPIKKMFDL
ncbi:MAG: hypothetical protein EA359_08105 [Balneolaceae bacterium]|nr:MAG: hypothetical protein EA359_08105 [Balneolaceae bacterium]